MDTRCAYAHVVARHVIFIAKCMSSGVKKHKQMMGTRYMYLMPAQTLLKTYIPCLRAICIRQQFSGHVIALFVTPLTI